MLIGEVFEAKDARSGLFAAANETFTIIVMFIFVDKLNEVTAVIDNDMWAMC